MKKSISGFTLVELLIVIVVIAILAAISIVAYNGIQQRAQNTARFDEIRSWQKLFELYNADHGAYPDMPDGGYCLGTGFPGGKCRDYLSSGTNVYTETNSTALMTAIKTEGTLPSQKHDSPVGGTIGPYINYWSTGFEITGVFAGNDASTCPGGMTVVWVSGDGRVLCSIGFTKP